MQLYWIAALLGFTMASGFHEPNMAPERTTLVYLFEWRWEDIAQECELFLGPFGYGGVQVSPPNENLIVWEPSWNPVVRRPWFERYQSVSYKVSTRGGGMAAFRDMVRRCNIAGVRIYVDVICNHMTGGDGNGYGTGGNYYDSKIWRYDGVPYRSINFNGHNHCPTASLNIEDYNDKVQVRNCRLEGLADLDTSQEYVRQKIIAYLNKLIDAGVAGFRIDAAKHVWPEHLDTIFSRMQNLSTEFFPPGIRPFIYQEVTDMGYDVVKAQEYTHLGRVTDFRFGKDIADIFKKNDGRLLKDLKNFGSSSWFLSDHDALVFLDNQDSQRGISSGGFKSILTYFDAKLYKLATIFMLAWPYGVPRVMSSYEWTRNIVDGKDENYWIGPPSDEYFNIKRVLKYSNFTCGNGWICEHRWREMRHMVQFRNIVGSAPVADWWDNGDNQIAFSRSGHGFVAVNNGDKDLDQKLQTGLPKGTYCDVPSGEWINGHWTGRLVEVDDSGYANIFIGYQSDTPVLAIHIGATV